MAQISQIVIQTLLILLSTLWALKAMFTSDKNLEQHSITRSAIYAAALFITIYINCKFP